MCGWLNLNAMGRKKTKKKERTNEYVAAAFVYSFFVSWKNREASGYIVRQKGGGESYVQRVIAIIRDYYFLFTFVHIVDPAAKTRIIDLLRLNSCPRSQCEWCKARLRDDGNRRTRSLDFCLLPWALGLALENGEDAQYPFFSCCRF